MTEILCIKSTSPHPDSPEAICVIEGCRYNVIEIREQRLYKLPLGTPNVWYILLETGKWLHHSANFILALPVLDEFIETKKELV